MITYYNSIQYNGNLLKDISKRFIIQNIKSKNTKDIYFDYLIKGWISPENLAYNFYGNCDYVWLILIANNIINPFEDWLLSDSELKEVIISKYGQDNIGKIHHYEKDSIIYKEYVEGSIAITNYNYEVDKNEIKRKIKIIYPELIPSIDSEIKNFFRK